MCASCPSLSHVCVPTCVPTCVSPCVCPYVCVPTCVFLRVRPRRSEVAGRLERQRAVRQEHEAARDAALAAAAKEEEAERARRQQAEAAARGRARGALEAYRAEKQCAAERRRLLRVGGVCGWVVCAT